MTDLPNTEEMLAQIIAGKGKPDLETLATLFGATRAGMHSALRIENLDPTGHLLGLSIDYSGARVELRIPPHGAQVVVNFSFLTMWFFRLQVDPPVRLTNMVNNVCFYEVNLLKSGGHNIQQQFINPHQGANATYGLDVADRLIVVPVSMNSYLLRADSGLVWASAEEDRLLQSIKE